jgi:hypothetical protein
MTLAHQVDPHVYRTMQEMLRLLEWNKGYTARLTPVPLTLADIEHAARRCLHAVIDSVAGALTAESERLTTLATLGVADHPLPPGTTRSQLLEQSTAYGRAAHLVKDHIRFTPRPHPKPHPIPNLCGCCGIPFGTDPRRYRSDRAPFPVCRNCSFENVCEHTPRTPHATSPGRTPDTTPLTPPDTTRGDSP